ncbi:MAG: methyltransferase domain-containing protein [Nitriliruptorales bacterium]|nr:methyltransferase domain-containing protein [Nitriliruptorales bacterium]
MDVKQQQVIYHDWESAHYEQKWAISFDQRCIEYVRGRFLRAVPGGGHFEKVVEVGCGTGFFLLNLAQAGFVGELHCTDIASKMVARCVENGRTLGIDVHGSVADAERLPYPDATFDLLVGHAVLHHLPDLDAALSEFRRVLKPGGRLVIAGEPTYLGDRVANRVKQAARVGVKLLAVVAGAGAVLATDHADLAAEEHRAASLEPHVDLHTFRPQDIEVLARSVGFADVTTLTEELTANWFGWATRTAEAMLKPGILPDRYPWLAYRTWQTLFAFDDQVLRRVLPKDVFYNCILTAAAPAD